MNEISVTAIELSEKLSGLLGLQIGAEHIHHISENGSGWYYYIQGLKAQHPLVLAHYRGPLMAVLPYADWQRLEDGGLEVSDYIDAAKWNYGYFWGGGGLISGAYWQPLEEQQGIHDVERISRYLEILRCRTFKRSSGYMPSAHTCQQCRLDETACPFSTCNKTGAWENEVSEYDARIKLLEAVSARIYIEYGLEVKTLLSHADEYHKVIVTPIPHERNAADIRLSRDLLNDCLYHPAVESFEALAADLEVKYELPPTYEPTNAEEIRMLYGTTRLSLPQRIRRFITNLIPCSRH